MRRFMKGYKWGTLIACVWYLTVSASGTPGATGTDAAAIAADIRLFALGPRQGPSGALP